MRSDFSPPKGHINITSTHGGLGDMLARIPAVKYVVEEHPHITWTIYWPDYFLSLAKYLYSHSRLEQKEISSLAGKEPAEPRYTFEPGRLSTLRLHLTQHAFLMLTDSLAPSEEVMQYPEAQEVDYLPIDLWEHSKYVVFTAAYTAKVREWPAFIVNDLAERVRKMGFTPVLLGTSKPQFAGKKFIQGNFDEKIDRSLFVDLSDKTTLIECLGIMQSASAVCGVDNGLLHLAHYTRTPVVAGYTSVAARNRTPYRRFGDTRIIEAEIPCYGCQSKKETIFVNHEWRNCLYQDNACTLTMRAARFETALREVLHV